jgi:hypothetical protein
MFAIVVASAVVVSVLTGCGGSSPPKVPSAGVFRLTNDSSETVNVTDCGGDQPTGCVEHSKVVLSPGKSAGFPLSSAKIGSTPNSVAIHRAGEATTCLTIGPSQAATLSANVSQARAKDCTIQDLHST